jgi:putative flippase GtrA
MAKVPAAAVSFIFSNTLHYVFGRAWIYRGTERRLVPGYVYFLMNAGVGLAATIGLFAFFVGLGLQYLLARIVASIFVGLLLFVLNAVWNFRSL